MAVKPFQIDAATEVCSTCIHRSYALSGFDLINVTMVDPLNGAISTARALQAIGVNPLSPCHDIKSAQALTIPWMR